MKILDIGVDIPVVGYQHHAMPLNILFTKNTEAERYMANNYIQLVCIPRTENSVNFYPMPNSFLKCLKGEDVLHDINVLEVIQKSIDNNVYIMGYADMYYIPFSTYFRTTHFNHEIMIYGYEENNFYTLFYDRTGYYSKHTLPIKCVVMAITENKSLNKKALTKLKLIKNYNYNINLQEIIRQLKDFTSSINSDKNEDILPPPPEALFGLDAERCFVNELELHRNINEFHILYEHKKCMISRLELISKLYQIDMQSYIEQYRKLSTVALGLRNAKLKMCMKHTDEILDNTTVLHMIEGEEKILPKLIASLSSLL